MTRLQSQRQQQPADSAQAEETEEEEEESEPDPDEPEEDEAHAEDQDEEEEKPEEPKSNFAIPGLYIFDSSVSKVSKSLKPSKRGETEIIDVIKHYLLLQKLKVYKINRGCAWLDAGTPRSLNDASEYVKVIERRQGVKIGCPEESAVKSGLIDKKSLLKTLEKMPNCDYKNYLLKL